jgi:hypothetical protein
MPPEQPCGWRTAAGADDGTRSAACLEQADIPWCAICGVAVNHRAAGTFAREISAIPGCEVTAFPVKAILAFPWEMTLRGRPFRLCRACTLLMIPFSRVDHG